ncbi:putative liporotein [synthetic Mycoplasma mycoides JCVI-syn1.0]|uniref:Lipoprotein n=1 Tax=Mycoplasma mycoides subsp. capri TaxID=40477 RepID=A0AB38GEV3_MYCMC|nr:aromatic motif membrane protein [Mycoplasma mycoides]ADH22074.1 putative liporotein [synthetic Mycoplasma mycoides JCVI-syn1.0]ACU78571.1 putative liporotein [Mycoplasma mycoides subsp. capri str. GM12]ACU79402.1 putative liporotein [Mycoplasma mycoides subsp. capri str. GM12]SRX62008.1 lipoprotein [Mycoplasma mycoides subsp. capri]SRX62452.1 lipoprotein [Mycoplasma mycoides subsp. capri]
MKKWLLSSLVVFLIPTTSCSIKNNNKEKIINKQEFKFYDNKNINQLLDLYIKDQQQKQLYTLKQENISDAKVSDLKFVLTFYTVFNSNRSIESVTTHYQQVALKAKKTLQNTLTNDWYWLLKHINQFDFNFNPFDDRYKHFKLEQNLIDYVYKTHNNLLTKINDKYPSEIFVFNINDIEDLDSFKNKQAIYLVYDKSKVLKILKYEINDKTYFQIFTDLLWFKDYKNLKEQLEQIENKIFEKRNDKLNEALKEYIEELEDSEDEEANDQINDKLQDIWDRFIENCQNIISSINGNLMRQFERSLRMPNNTFLRTFTNKDESVNKWKDEQLKNINHFLEKNSNTIMNSEKIKKELVETVNKISEELNSIDFPNTNKNENNEGKIKKDFLEKYKLKNDDLAFYKLHAKRQYTDIFIEVLDEINNIKRNEESKNNIDLKVIRYSMRNIYEEK